MMNIKKTIGFWVVGLLLCAGCSSLDMDPVSEITDKNYWKTPEQFDSFVYGLHARFRSQSWNFFLLGEARSDVFGDQPFGGEAAQGMERYPMNTLNADNPGLKAYGDLYQNLNQMNLFIRRAESTEVLSEPARRYYLGQVYGLRAYYLFQLFRSWGHVVFTEEPSLDFDISQLARKATPAAEVLEQVKRDVEASLTHFGTDYGFRDQRALWSKAATLMLKGEVYLWGAHREGGAADARVAAEALDDLRQHIGPSELDLLPSYQEVFAYRNKGNREMIFVLHNQLFEHQLWNGNNDLYPQADYLDKYCNADGTPISLKVENNWGIMRLMVKLDNFRRFLPGDTRRDVTLKDVYRRTPQGNLELVGLYPHKYPGVMNGGTRVRCDDYPIYRYADWLLMRAEAKALLGEDPSAELNAVRRRAFGTAYQETTLGYPHQSIDRHPLDAILQERFFEFLLEGKRWNDLRRWGDATVVAHTLATADRLWWPIDRKTLTDNPLLKQTPGYETGGHMEHVGR